MTYGTLPPGRYPPTSKLLHWSVAVLVLATIPIAVAMTRVDPGAVQDTLYNTHKAIGLLILVLMLARLANRFVAGAPAPEPGIAAWQKNLSSAVHGTLYILLLGMPVVGAVANSYFGASLPFFGLFEIPPFTVKDEKFSEGLFAVHRWIGYLVAILVIMHVSGALYHRLIRGDGVLQRMLPVALGGR